MKIGLGIDIHRFTEGRKLILGGTEIPFHKGLEGHSDADVLLHSICDALLGAAGLNDIGHYFPNTSEKFKDISSLTLLDEVLKLLKEEGLEIVNIDCTLLMEEPMIGRYIDRMKENICNSLGLNVKQLSIKATTAEGLGFVGSKEGAAAYSVCMLK